MLNKSLVIFLSLIFLSGCAAVTEGVKGVAGVSTKVLEDNRKDAIKKEYTLDYKNCFKKAEDVLSKKGVYIYSQSIKKHMIAVYVSISDTTPVGLFFKEIDASNTSIEFSSPSTYAKELIAKIVTRGLNPKKVKEGEVDEEDIDKEGI